MNHRGRCQVFSRPGKRNKQQAARSKLSHCIVVRAPRAGMRCKIATSLHQTHQILAWTIQNAPKTALGPKNAIEPGHFRHSPQLPRPPIGPAVRSEPSCDCGTRNQRPQQDLDRGHGPSRKSLCITESAWAKMSCQRAITHTVAFRAPLRPQPPNYIRIPTATAVQSASSPTSLATTPQKLTPFLVPALGCLEAKRK